LIPADVPTSDLRVAHSYLDSLRVESDINCVFPIDRVRELVDEAYIAETSSDHFGLMGHVPESKRLFEKTIPEIIQKLKQEKITAVLITPGDCLGHQTDAVIQREIEKQGISTVSVSLCRDITEHIGVPRCVSVRYPFGHTFGPAADDIMQMRILKDALQLLETAEEPGQVVPLPYEWITE
jgi:D-proline reductase (dithiol) PrdB